MDEIRLVKLNNTSIYWCTKCKNHFSKKINNDECPYCIGIETDYYVNKSLEILNKIVNRNK